VPLPSTKPPTASLRVIHAPRRSRSRSSINARTTSESLGSRKSSTPSTSGRNHLPGGKSDGEDSGPRAPSTGAARRAAMRLGGRVERTHTISLSAASGSSTSSAPVACSNSRT
jgi:hypothetical protein